MSEHDLDARLREWAHASAQQAAPDALRRQVQAIPAAETKTASRPWTRLLPGLTPTAGAYDQAQPVPTSQRDGGTRSMFSATKLFGVAASIALLSVMALAVPFTTPRQDASIPGAMSPGLTEVTSLTGEMELLGKDQIGTAAELDSGAGRYGEQWTSRLTTTDRRYSGLVTGFHNYHQLDPGDAFVRVHKSRLFSEEENGTWLNTGYGYVDPKTSGVTWVTQATGEGLYEGLSAYTICEQTFIQSGKMACHGIIFEGQWPELPSEAPLEIPAVHLRQ